MRLVLSFVIGSLVLPVVAAAQQARPARGTMISPSAGGAVIPSAALSSGTRVFAAAPNMRLSGSAGPRRMQIPGAEFRSFQTTPFETFPVQTVSFDNVPGLGFDYPHLAAVTRGQPRQRPTFEPIVPLGFQGILFSPPVAPTVVIVQQPPVVEIPEYSRPASYGESPRDHELEIDSVPERTRASARRESEYARARTPTETSPREVVPAPRPDSAQYVFVQRNGSLLFAVAYSWEKGMLRYITPEGLRRSVGRDKLDLDATEQFNEQRGLVFRSPG